MLKRRALVMFVVALTLGIAAAWLANKWIQMRVLPRAEAATTPIVVAALKIPYGQKIEAVHVKAVGMPPNLVPEGAFTDTAAVVGKIASQTLVPGETLLPDRVVDQLGGSTLSALITPKMRAVTVRVNDVVGVGGFLLPGNRVDVLATRKDRNEAETRTVLQDLKVLAVDQTASTEKDKPVIVRAVTLEVSPEQSEVLVRATNEGSVQLTLRNPQDSWVVARDEPKPKAAARTPYSVTIIRGTTVNEQQANL